MKLSSAILALALRYAPRPAVAQTCSGVTGPFALTDITGACVYETLLYEYTRQVFDATGSTCAAGSTLTAQEDLDAKLMSATGASSGPEGAEIVCKAMYDNADQTPFTNAADMGTDFHFEQMFYNGRTDWQEEVETLYESDDRTATSVLREDASKVREFFEGEGSYSRVQWPNMLTNFDDSTCASHAAMCCWPKDRQANDGNGNCATPYDENCVNKDPADNTNLCFTDLAKGNLSTGFNSNKGFISFPEDNNNGEGAIHCHGFAWADDKYDTISRYKANNLFFVSMYDHMHQRGYVKNIPGAPMCGCMEQMPIATRSDCTQVDLTEDWSMEFDGTSFTGRLDKVEIDFNSCRGRNNRNNDLWAYAARLYDEGRMTRHQFGAVGRVLTNDHDCYTATEYEKAKKGYVVGYEHDKDTYTKVAGRDDMSMETFGREAFNTAFFDQTLTPGKPIIMRICPDCTKTHRKVWYRRLTSINDQNFDLLHHILNYRNNNPHPDNRWNEDFTLHSTYEDAVSGDNPWLCPGNSFYYNAVFYGECSPDGTRVRDQYSFWTWFPGPRPNVAYYVNKPQDHGVQDYFDNDDVTKAPGLEDEDIGVTGAVGNTLHNGDVFHITGAGSDIWHHSDQFHYKHQPWEGDIDVKVQVSSFTNPSNQDWHKAGIMLRSDDSTDATNMLTFFSAKRGLYSQIRRSKGRFTEAMRGPSVHYNPSPQLTSTWLRILKKMETVETYCSDTGEDDDWTLMASDSIFFPEDKYRVGLAVTSHHTGVTAEAVFEKYEIVEYNFPTSAPSTSSAPTSYDKIKEIGEEHRPGSYSVNPESGIESIMGSGTGLWGTSDSFFFYNEQRPNEDMSVELYINKFDNGYVHGRGGIMIRDSHDADAANVFVGAAGTDQGVVFQSRSNGGAKTVHHNMLYINQSNTFWVKLDRVVDTFTASYKAVEGDDWIVLGEVDVELTSTHIKVGRAVTSGHTYWSYMTMETRGIVITTP